jgi:hypothetical protein
MAKNKIMRMEIFERTYDNPLKKDGTPKDNKKIGDFLIIETISEDCYTSERIGIKDSQKYLIQEYEVCGYNGGSRFEIEFID